MQRDRTHKNALSEPDDDEQERTHSTHATSFKKRQLRVCDASVMPDLPKANTHHTTVAIAERLTTKMRS